MRQQGQVLPLKTRGDDAEPLWAYRYRLDGRGSKRVQRGGYATRQDACDALERALASVERRRRGSQLSLAELVDEYLAQHDAQPETLAKLRWLLDKSVARFGERPIRTLDSREIAAWRMTIPPGHRFEATQALRQVLARAIAWELIDVNPAKRGVDNPPPRHREMRPFDSQHDIDTLATVLGRDYGPMIQFAAATGLRPGEWIALQWRDVDRDSRLVHVRRSFSGERLKTTKTDTARAVPLQRTALEALDSARSLRGHNALVFPAPEGGHLDLHNWRPRHSAPAQKQAGIAPARRVYDYADLWVMPTWSRYPAHRLEFAAIRSA